MYPNPMNFIFFEVYLHDVNVSADELEAVDTNREEPSPLNNNNVGKDCRPVSPSHGRKGNCIANLLLYVTDIVLSSELLEKI